MWYWHGSIKQESLGLQSTAFWLNRTNIPCSYMPEPALCEETDIYTLNWLMNHYYETTKAYPITVIPIQHQKIREKVKTQSLEVYVISGIWRLRRETKEGVNKGGMFSWSSTNNGVLWDSKTLMKWEKRDRHTEKDAELWICWHLICQRPNYE